MGHRCIISWPMYGAWKFFSVLLNTVTFWPANCATVMQSVWFCLVGSWRSYSPIPSFMLCPVFWCFHHYYNIIWFFPSLITAAFPFFGQCYLSRFHSCSFFPFAFSNFLCLFGASECSVMPRPNGRLRYSGPTTPAVFVRAVTQGCATRVRPSLWYFEVFGECIKKKP